MSKQGSDITSTTHKSGNTSVGVNVTTKTEVTPIGQGMELNPEHFKTIPGLLKLLQLLIAVICLGCASPALTDFARFFLFVVALYFIITILLCIVYFFGLKKLLSKLPWLLIELAATSIGALLYFIACIVMLAMTTRRDYAFALRYYGLGNYYGQYVAAGVFAIVNTLLYGAGTLFLFNEFRESRTGSVQNGNA